jgi:hypothetical protein
MVMYAKVENGTIVKTTTDLRKEFPNTSFPRKLPESFGGWDLITGTPDVPEGKVIEGHSLQVVDGKPKKVYTYKERTPEEIAEKAERARVNAPANIAAETNSVLIRALAEKIGLTVSDIERVK